MDKSDKMGPQERATSVPRRGALGKGGGLCTHNLKLDRLALELNSANLKVNANCRYVAFCVGIVCETEEEARLEGMSVNL